VSQRAVEIIVGRLVTDEEFRRHFIRGPSAAIDEIRGAGLELSEAEVTALLATDAGVWTRVASAVDRRLQKASLRTRPGDEHE
jgi:hypothetical protein